MQGGENGDVGGIPQCCAKSHQWEVSSHAESTYLSMNFSNSLHSCENESEKGKLSCEHSKRVSGTPGVLGPHFEYCSRKPGKFIPHGGKAEWIGTDEGGQWVWWWKHGTCWWLFYYLRESGSKVIG